MLTLYYLSSQPSWGLERSLLLVISENRCKGECTPGKQWKASTEIWAQEDQRERAVHASVLLTQTCLKERTEWREDGKAFWSILTLRKITCSYLLFARLSITFSAMQVFPWVFAEEVWGAKFVRAGVQPTCPQGRSAQRFGTERNMAIFTDQPRFQTLTHPLT